jgi:hypothetical protein
MVGKAGGVSPRIDPYPMGFIVDEGGNVHDARGGMHDGGLRWVVSNAYKDSKWHWTAYVPQGDGLATRYHGVEDTYEQAVAKARRAA